MSLAPEQSNAIPRRGLLKYLLGFSAIATLGGVLTPIIGYLWPPLRQTTAPLITGDDVFGTIRAPAQRGASRASGEQEFAASLTHQAPVRRNCW